MLDCRDRLRREYLYKEYVNGAPLPKGRGGLSFDGHRLSSLYCDDNKTVTGLIQCYRSSLQKYSKSNHAAGTLEER